MKKLIMFLAGLMLLGITCGMLFMSSAIYDAGRRHTIDTFFFQTNNLSTMRLGTPAPAADFGDDLMRDMLVRQYVHEYFYAVPDAENIAQRINGQSVLRSMSGAAVFAQWQDTEAQTIKSLVEDRGMRTVRVIGKITRPAESDYWIVNYELKTWPRPNDFFVAPKITHGTLYLNIVPETGLIETRDSIEIGKYLESGRPPAAIFKFRVQNLERQ